MKKLLFLSVLSLFCAGNPGAVSAQSGVRYPYVAKDAKGNACIIVCRDYQGGMNPDYILTYRELHELHDRSTSNFGDHNSGFSPRFQVAYKDIPDLQRHGDACQGYREDTATENNRTWRLPTQRELWLIYIMESRGLFSGIDAFLTNYPYWSASAYNNTSQYYTVKFGGSDLGFDYYSYSNNFWIRCVRDLDFVYQENN